MKNNLKENIHGKVLSVTNCRQGPVRIINTILTLHSKLTQEGYDDENRCMN